MPPRRRAGRLATALTGLVMLFAGAFASVTLTGVVAETAEDIDVLEERLAEARSERAGLLVEVAELEHPARLARAAEELGLVPAARARQLRVERVLPADGLGVDRLDAGDTADALKPLLAGRP